MDLSQIKPIWNSSTFLVYTGGLTVLFAGIGALEYLATQYRGHGAQTAWALLIFFVLLAIAMILLMGGRPIAAGIFAFSSVIAWTILVGLAFTWWGWTNSAAWGDFGRWSWARLFFELLILFFALAALRVFRFPFIALVSSIVGWVFVIDLISSGGTWTQIVSFVVGLLYFLVGAVSDKPSAFWLHFIGGLLVGVPLLIWCHTSTFDFAVIAFFSLVYIAVAHATRRSIWAVYGTIGFFIATVHFLVGSPTEIAQNAVLGQPPSISAWSFPLGFGLLGFWLVLLGMLGRRVKDTPPAPPPAAPAPPAPPPAEPTPA
ncbi:MAG TPA: hypothetical protein VKB43_07435 [Gaiellaceae bacterium]|nr:hypothetical protein [Gaiellaceae bacterium]